jgi:hypothetical protein
MNRIRYGVFIIVSFEIPSSLQATRGTATHSKA